MIGGVEVYRAKADFEQDGKTYAAGTFVIPFNQVFARYAKDLLEKQIYPEVRRAPGAPAEAPYDVSRVVARHAVRREDRLRQDRRCRKALALEQRAATPSTRSRAANTGGAWRFPYNGAHQRAC